MSAARVSSRDLIRKAAADCQWHTDPILQGLGIDHFTKGSRFVEIIYNRRGSVGSVRIGTPEARGYHVRVEKHDRNTVLTELERETP